jgi:hypothetical protein
MRRRKRAPLHHPLEHPSQAKKRNLSKKSMSPSKRRRRRPSQLKPTLPSESLAGKICDFETGS